MKKLYTLIAALFVAGTVSVKAQNVLLYQNFKFQSFFNDTLVNNGTSPPPGNSTDYQWYTFDLDGLGDASGGNRPGEWFAIIPFSDVDLYDGAGDTNVCMAANSWINAPYLADKWLVTSSVQLGAHDTLFWKSAPRQTPRYLDGYKVKISTTTNDDVAFSTTLFTAKEMTALGSDTTFSTFTFGPSGSGFVHGQDGTYIDYAGAGTNPAHRGRLRPFSIPLDTYANQKVFIAFHQNSTDDNLISIDDVMIRGTLPNAIQENELNINLNLFPNPATDKVQVNYELKAETAVTISLFDVTGKLVSVETKAAQPQGRQFAFINVADLAKGFYTVSVKTNNGTSTAKLIVK